MLKQKRKLILLILTIILTFVFGVWLELDYRIFTRRTVIFFADYKLGFYGGKDFRMFETDIALILTLIPIGFYSTSREVGYQATIRLILFYLISLPTFFCLYCFFESQIIEMTITTPLMDNGVLKYHQNNVDYRMILFLTIFSTYILGIIFKKIIKGKKPFVNN